MEGKCRWPGFAMVCYISNSIFWSHDLKESSVFVLFENENLDLNSCPISEPIAI